MGVTLDQVIDRLADRFDVVDNGCWVWNAWVGVNGYGYLYERGSGKALNRGLLAHRVMYEAVVGPLSPNLEIDHLCRNKACVNPDHLEQVTHAVNSRRWAAHRFVTCDRGHDDWVRRPGGRRFCRTCNNEGQRRRHHQRKGKSWV